jgi:benzoyl-CoA reductase/2-hydroxyglutaryl-CoA dehydratase subunit BcrC/BadD/HgdB
MKERFGPDVIGITSTVPIEVIYSAGLRPVDLNNVFITEGQAVRLVEDAERRGFPLNMCAWVKGIYTVVKEKGLKRVVGVTEGDCSPTHGLVSVLKSEGTEIVEFRYPGSREEVEVKQEVSRFARHLGTEVAAAEEMKKQLDEVRQIVRAIDDLTWQTGQVTSQENHYWCINTSDFWGDPETFATRARAFLNQARKRPPTSWDLRLGLLGIPPIVSNLYQVAQSLNIHIAFNEFQRQFSMPYETKTLAEQYMLYTYPYDISFRAEDTKREVRRRRLDGLIHYVQSFCHRHLEDKILRRNLALPILTLEFDRPGEMDARSRTRLEAFAEMLRQKKSRKPSVEAAASR